MSFCRWGPDSDLYLFEATEGFVCCGCPINNISITLDSLEELINHVKIHITKGDKVPDYVLPELIEEYNAKKEITDNNNL